MGICVPQKKIGDHAMLFSFWFVFILPLSESFLFFSHSCFSGSLSDSPKYEGYIHEVCLISLVYTGLFSFKLALRRESDRETVNERETWSVNII